MMEKSCIKSSLCNQHQTLGKKIRTVITGKVFLYYLESLKNLHMLGNEAFFQKVYKDK